MSHFLKFGDNGLKDIDCCANCRHLDGFENDTWVELHCIANDNKLLPSKYCICNLYQEGKTDV